MIRLFEKLMCKRMVRFFQKHKLISLMHFGFRPKRSCLQSISTKREFTRTQIDNKLSGQACFIDLKKAFDSNNHNILLQKIYAYGFRGPIHDLVHEFLKDRMQYVFWDQKRSTPLKITTGVPQRSVLGQFLFSIYIKDSLEYAKNTNQVAMFADDISLVKTGERK